MNNKQREGGYWDTPHGLLAQVENLCALEHELIFSEISELASRAREAMLTPPAPSDWESEVYVVWTVDAAGGIVVRKVFDDRHTASLYRSGIHDIVCHITTARMFRSKVLTTNTSDPKGPEEG